ncbi:hypothetical protein KAR48_02435 [bacterium]|nr:hypothetical protein [bacterium]
MSWFDQLVLLATGLTAIYLLFRFFQDSKRNANPVHNLFYMISFAVLLVSGLLLIFLGWGILPSPWVIVVTTFLPMGIATGLVHEFYPEYGRHYLIFAVIGLLAIAITRFTNAGAIAVVALAFFHSIAGLTIVLIPWLAVKAGKVIKEYLFVSLGGILIGLGGIALAFLKSGSQLLFFSGDFVMMILAPLLFLMALSYAFGFVKKIVSSSRK